MLNRISVTRAFLHVFKSENSLSRVSTEMKAIGSFLVNRQVVVQHGHLYEWIVLKSLCQILYWQFIQTVSIDPHQ